MEILSTNHLVECMQETMEPTQRRLMFIYPLVRRENAALCDYLERWVRGVLSLIKFMMTYLTICRSTVGTLFALPWYLTWFGHSLNSYRSVVRLYDYFLASDFLLPIYVTSAIVLYRQNEIFQEDCDMASLHCLLSQVSIQIWAWNHKRNILNCCFYLLFTINLNQEIILINIF